MLNPFAFVGGLLGFFLGVYLTKSIFLGLIFSMIGSSLGSSLGIRFFRRSSHNRTGTGPGWFSGWSASSAHDGPLFMEHLFSMLGCVAMADGNVSAEEERLFRQVVVNELHINNPSSIASAMEIFRRGAEGRTPIHVHAGQAAKIFHARPQLLEMMLLLMIRVTAAKGSLHPEEDRLMREVSSLFNFRPGAYETLKNRYGVGGSSGSSFGGDGAKSRAYSSASSGNLHAAYDVLGVSSSANESEIRRAYRKKVAQYHPDKIAAKGLPEEFTEFANQKFREVQESWDLIRSAKGL